MNHSIRILTIALLFCAGACSTKPQPPVKPMPGKTYVAPTR
jgi:hypothetical protein